MIIAPSIIAISSVGARTLHGDGLFTNYLFWRWHYWLAIIKPLDDVPWQAIGHEIKEASRQLKRDRSFTRGRCYWLCRRLAYFTSSALAISLWRSAWYYFSDDIDEHDMSIVVMTGATRY